MADTDTNQAVPPQGESAAQAAPAAKQPAPSNGTAAQTQSGAPAEPAQTPSGAPAQTQPPQAAEQNKTILGGHAPKEGDGGTPDKNGDGKNTGDGQQDKDSQPVYDLKAPQGMEFAPGALEEFTAFAQTQKISPETAQKLIDLEAKYASAAAKAQAQQWQTQAQELAKGHETELARAMAACGADLSARIDQSGLGNHPLLVEMALALGRALGEDKSVTGAQTSPSRDVTFEEAMYGKGQ